MPTGFPNPDADPAPSEVALFARAQTADRAAFGALYRLHYPAIVGCLFRRTGDGHTAEDLAADTFLAAFRALPRYRITEVPLRIWLLRIATNTANRWARDRRKLKLTRIALVPISSGSVGDPRAATEEAQAALLALSPSQQAVLSLHYLESLTLDEVGAVLGCPNGTVKSRLSRAREAMRVELQRRSQRHG